MLHHTGPLPGTVQDYQTEKRLLHYHKGAILNFELVCKMAALMQLSTALMLDASSCSQSGITS